MSHEPAGGRNSLSPQGQVLAGPFPSSEFQVQGNSGTKPLFYAPLNMYHVGLGWIPREDCMYLFHWSSTFALQETSLRINLRFAWCDLALMSSTTKQLANGEVFMPKSLQFAFLSDQEMIL